MLYRLSLVCAALGLALSSCAEPTRITSTGSGGPLEAGDGDGDGDGDGTPVSLPSDGGVPKDGSAPKDAGVPPEGSDGSDGSGSSPKDMAPPPDLVTPPDLLCVPSTVELLENGNLDGTPIGTGWSQSSSYALVVASSGLPVGSSQSGANAAWLGGAESTTDGLYQDIAVPAGVSSLKLTGYRWISTEDDPSPYDYLYVQLRNTSGSVLETVTQWSNADTTTKWTAFTATPTGNYAGQTIRLYFQAKNDGLYPTDFLLDTLSLTAVSACP